MKKLITTAALGAAVLGGTVAYAATSILPASAQTGQSTVQNGDQSAAKDGQQQRLDRRHRLGKAFIKISADTIGVQPKDLLAELKAGKSVADVATEHGKNPQDVIDALVAKVDERVDKAVQEGKLPADRAAEIKAKAPERITKLVNAHRQPGQQPGNN